MKTIGDYFDIKGGKRLPKGSSFSQNKTPFPYIRVTDFQKNGLKSESIKYIDATVQSKIKRYTIEAGAIYISIAGTIGIVGIIPDEFNGANLTENAAKIVPKKGVQVHNRFISYLLNSDEVQQIIESKTMAVGVPKLALFRIQEIPIILPPLATQKKIAAILDAADAYRQKTKTLIEKYDQLAQSLFLDMFGDPVRNEKGWETKTIEKLVKNEKGSIKRGPFGGALKKEIFVEDGYLVYEQFHALNNDFTFERYYINEAKFQELKGFEVKPGDIIISCSGVYLGKLAVVPQGAKRGIINQALLKLTVDQNKMRNDFFIFHFTHKNFKDKYFEANRGAGIPNFPPMEDFKRFQFISPPIFLQTQFAERIQLIEAQKQQAQASLQKAEELFNSLLQRAFKGELVS
jgi:type I restriction enzyme S subunit